ncbi:MAG: right-handed parallel beta-helix repeat-containing protein [Clostridia bacterium]|nr:right-handed parallel beta-helix repeat-containing protein [Clostridia bacterium]
MRIKKINENIERGTFLIESDTKVTIGKNVTVTAIHDVDSFYTDDSVFWDTCGNELGRALFFANGKQNIEFIGEEGNLIDGRGGLWFEGDEKSHNRPSLIRFVNCKNVTLKNLNLIDSPCWCIHIQNCENVLIDGLTIKSYCNHNNDGIDIDGCTNVIVQNCRVENGDDAIVVKATKNIPSKNILIKNCTVNTLGAGFKIGTETVGDISDVKYIDNVIEESVGGSIKIMSADGSNINGVLVKNVNIIHGTGPLFIANGYRMRKYFDGHTREIAGSIKNVTVQNVTANVYCNEENPYAKVARGVLLVTGTPKTFIENLEISDCSFNMPGGITDKNGEYEVKELTDGYPEFYFLGTTPSYGAYIRHAQNVKIKNVKFNLAKPDVRDKIITNDVKNVTIE